tara:strand:+ start:1412 stop:2947 length:1536 start_codon:yes stop_codon:yes gene_type:complete
MEEYKVLITTSGIGSRLGNITNFTNKCLARIGDKPAISYIIESYPVNTQFVITLGHFGKYVKEFLILAYPNKNFTFVLVDKFKGKGSSLGYSILKAKSHLQCPFIFHASDTILTPGDKINPPEFNWCAGAYKEETSQYRTLRINNDKVTFINEKGEINFDYPYIGLCGVKDYTLFWKCLELLPKNPHLSDVHVINKMLKSVDFKFKKINKWLDIGNVTELNKTRKHFSSNIEVLDKQNESIYFFDNFVIKFFSDAVISKNRVSRALNLYPFVPKILNSTTNFYKYQKVEGKLFSKSVTETSFSQLLEWANDNLWIKKSKDLFSKDCNKFYITKSLNRISTYLETYTDPPQVNGEFLPSIKVLFDKLDKKKLCSGIPSQFHGDFILDNIIETKDGFSLIDWRQDFAGDLEIGDLYYDLAKLNHNLTVNHNIIEQNLFNSSPDNCYILCNSTLLRCKILLHKFIMDKGYDLNKVEMLTSIIWLNMAPLHEYPFNRFLFNFGKYNLYKNLQNVS